MSQQRCANEVPNMLILCNVYVLVCSVCARACILTRGYWRVGVIAAYTGARTAEAIVSEGINLARSTANERLSGKSSGVSAPTVYWIRIIQSY